jgi:hypothetical protein
MKVNVNPFVDIQLSMAGDTITVQYQIDPMFSGQAPYTFELQAFQDESFQEPLYCITGTEFFIVDNVVARQNQLPSFFYKLKLTTQNGYSYYSNFFGYHPSDNINRHKFLLANEIARKERVRFNYIGTFAYLLKRKSYSCSVDSDVDPVTGEPLVDNTNTFGVGVLGGYYSPILTRFTIENKETKTDYDNEGRGSQYTEILSIRSIGFPFIDQHDIIVTKDAKRFTVVETNNQYFPGTTLTMLQLPTLRLVPSLDTVYSISIPPFPYEHNGS